MARVIVIGSGIAGLTCALRLADRHEVTVVTKDNLGQSNTALAQGGIAGVIGTADTVEAHVADTLAAGAGLCDAEAVDILCVDGARAVLELAASGVEFDRDESGAWARGMEGAHSFARIFHAGGDATGAAISEALSRALRAEVAAGRVRLCEHTMLLDILGPSKSRNAQGVSVLQSGRVKKLTAEAVVLATGGAGQLFAQTTNPASATGDGLAAALRAGARARDLEFFQFHPTALAGAGFLVSEAVRGAGALLLDAAGRRFMPEVDPRAELAPRDVVALALHRRMAAQAGQPCYLDARAVPEVAARFPSISRALSDHGLRLDRDLIPVTPAAHYFMGGIATDLDGRTDVAGLFAVGEVACTGVHGANRLASNSLLEGAVFAARTAEAIETDLAADQEPRAVDEPHADHEPRASATAPLTVPEQTDLPRTELSRTELQELTWTHLGVRRSEDGLRELLSRLGEGAAQPSFDGLAHDELVERIETANLALIAAHMAEHALARQDSLGAHSRTDSRPPLPTTDSTAARLQEATAC